MVQWRSIAIEYCTNKIKEFWVKPWVLGKFSFLTVKGWWHNSFPCCLWKPCMHFQTHKLSMKINIPLVIFVPICLWCLIFVAIHHTSLRKRMSGESMVELHESLFLTWVFFRPCSSIETLEEKHCVASIETLCGLK